MPQITGGELDANNDEDDDPNTLLVKPPVYIGDQSALIAAINAEMTSQGKPAAFIAEVSDFLTANLPKVLSGLAAVAGIL